MIKILIADDHAIVRQGLKQILMDTPDMDVAGEATNGIEALTKIREEEWDVVLLDMSMPGKNGLDVLKQAKNEQKKLPILILSMHPEDQYAVRALKAGAAGYITKGCPPEQFITAIRRAARGGKYITPTLAEKLAQTLDSGASDIPHESLSDREFQVFEKLASGNKISAIAEELSLSAKTVSTHRA
ncbi:MAG: response regulator transcription factor, partial [Gammaproteobacteria bacterium]|nr:response regulator transcription factor [Gammaproteobacteria bacterium]